MDKKVLMAILAGLVNTVAASMEGGAEDKQNVHLAQGLVGRALKNPNIRETIIAGCGVAQVTATAEAAS